MEVIEFNEEQLAAIKAMIAQKVSEATDAQNAEMNRLREHNTTLIGEKRVTDDKAKASREEAERVRAEKIKNDGDIESAREAIALRDAEIATLRADFRVLNFDNAILDAVSTRNIHADFREDLVDALRFRATYDEDARSTTIDGKPLGTYMDELLASERGKRYVPASPATGAGAPGSSGSSQGYSMTAENFNADKFYSLPKAERNAIADRIGRPHLKEA